MSVPTEAQQAATSKLARVVFALLVVATAAAFVVTQRLKRAEPVVQRIKLPLYISPNGDGRKDTAPFSFDLPKGDDVTVAIVNANGDDVRRIVDARRLGKGVHAYVWDGRGTGGEVLPDGFYFVRVILRDQARAATSQRGIQLVTKPPHPRLLSVSPRRIAPDGSQPVTIRFRGPASPPPLFSVYRTDQGRPRLVARFQGRRLSHVAQWDGLVNGRPAAAGTYAFAVTVQNKALVSGSSPRTLPPAGAEARPGTGVTISGPQAAASLDPVAAGQVTRVQVTGARGHVRWSIERVGTSKPLRRGVGVAPSVRVAVPSRAKTGVYLVRLRTSAGGAVAPLVVRRGAEGGVLVVMPAIGWQALNPVDDDGNGFPDTLQTTASVPLTRPFANGRLPAGFAGGIAPLLGFLDRHHFRYDVTTDVALARGAGPGVAGRRGVVFAGSERWLPSLLQEQIRAYVQQGGRVASFGTDSFRRSVRIGRTSLSQPGPQQRANAFGERTALAASAPAPLVVNSDTIGLFAGSDGFVGLFSRFDQSQGLPAGARVLANAGRDPRHPAVVAYRIGRGVLIRVGAPQWSRQLADPEVSRATVALWSLLSR